MKSEDASIPDQPELLKPLRAVPVACLDPLTELSDAHSSRPRRRTSTVVRRIADFYLDLDYSKYLSSDGPITSPVIHKNMKRMYSRFT